MEYRNLVTFLRVAELQNFTQAANALGYAQSTVTFHIQSLEEELGVTLFDRIGKKVSLTMAGEYLISYANEMMHLESGIRELGEKADAVAGTLRVGIVESLLATYAGQAVPRYQKRYPRVSVEFRTASGFKLMELLYKSEVDLIFFMGKRIADPEFVRDLIRTAGVSFVTYAEHPLAGRRSIPFLEIQKEPLVLPERASFYRRIAEEIAAQYDCTLNPSIQIGNTAAILELLKSRAGISFLPDYLTRREVEAGRLAILDVKDPLHTHFYVQIFHHRNKWVTPQMKGFVEVMEELLGPEERPEDSKKAVGMLNL